MRLLLINPKFPESFWSFTWAIDEVLPRKRTTCPPLGLATLAALCPADWDVRIVDENVEAVPLDPEADIVGVCGMGVQFPRQRELLAHYRSRGYYTVAGGSYTSLCNEKYAPLADSVVAGEAEYIWKEFCVDFLCGEPKRLYHETGTVALTDSPTPRFDLLQLDRYSNATLQYSRGCPFRCEFCDIIVMFGRKPRVKSHEQIGRELDALRAAGMRSVFFVDDNLIGNVPQAKSLLRFLAGYQKAHDYDFSFGTEASLNLAQNRELLELFRDANFGWVFIGIESTDPDSLKETLKTQNLAEDILTSIRRIYAHDIDVLAGFIIGFDNDTLETFERQYQFITDAGIQSAMIGMLTAMPRTPLYERLQKEGRIDETEDSAENTRGRTNVVPKNMTLDAMTEGYRALYARLLTDAEIARRIRNKVRYLRAPAYRSGYSAADRMGILTRLIFKGILPGGVSRIAHFLRTLPIFTPARLPLVISDWIIGLSMRDYAERNLPVQDNLPVERKLSGGQPRPRPRSDQAAPQFTTGIANLPSVPADIGTMPAHPETNSQHRSHNAVNAHV
ncbi:MAG TPA: radical SAM protein [Burkholderiales bacterium]|nr:radical SAM protein [Burkholderiales bacterium]